MSERALQSRCRRTEGQTAPARPGEAPDDACWIQPPDGPRLAVVRPGGCLADTVDEAGRCAAETLADNDEP
jgi:hypothetical protein